jgi:hypothetical protein
MTFLDLTFWTQSVAEGGGGVKGVLETIHLMQGIYTLYVTRFIAYKIAWSPQGKPRR